VTGLAEQIVQSPGISQRCLTSSSLDWDWVEDWRRCELLKQLLLQVDKIAARVAIGCYSFINLEDINACPVWLRPNL